MSYLWWVIGLFGIGGTLAIFFIGWPVVLSFAQTKLGRITIFILGAIATVLAAFAKGADVGYRRAENKRNKIAGREVNAAKKEADRVRSLDNDAIDRELSDWDRSS